MTPDLNQIAQARRYSYEHSAVILDLGGVYALWTPNRNQLLGIDQWSELETPFLTRPAYTPTARPSKAAQRALATEKIAGLLGLLPE